MTAAAPLTARHTSRTLVFAILGAALFMAVVESSQSYVRGIATASPSPWLKAFLYSLPSWLIAAALVWPLIAVARHARLDRPPRARSIAILLAAAIVFILTHAALFSTITFGFFGVHSYAYAFSKVLTYSSVTDLMIVSGVVGGLHAYHAYRTLQDREVATAHLQASLTEARLQALRGQLNPHFLFNTLNAISVLALKNDQKAVVQTLSRLSDLLRISLAAEPLREVPLANELEFIDGYLEIQRLRFPDRLTIVRHIDNEAMDGLVPSMILQPLVENAVVHGIAPHAGKGVLTLTAACDNGHLRLEVRDSGPGFISAEPARTGIGLQNTRARLDQLYGEAHTFAVGNAPQGGTLASIVLPMRRHQEAPA